MEEKFMYGTISVSVSLPERINVVRVAAGTGKTFLAKTLGQLTFKGYEVILVNYGNYKVISYEQISELGDNTLLILDNTNLYMTKELQQAILCNNVICLIFTRDTRFFNISNSALCVVEYSGKELSISGFNYSKEG